MSKKTDAGELQWIWTKSETEKKKKRIDWNEVITKEVWKKSELKKKYKY